MRVVELLVFSSKKVLAVDFRHYQVLDLVGSAVAFPKSIEFWKDRRICGLLRDGANEQGPAGGARGRMATIRHIRQPAASEKAASTTCHA
eukprot:COSAG01_NODE_2684_length_7258_cov_33.765791_3_plen_90_part_00